MGDIDAAAGEETCAAIGDDGGEAVFVQLDVRDETSWQRALRVATGSYEGLDVVVNNAGLPYRRLIE
ncbi:SDR family NAD(P)-dependent oxidoreductase, partial [Corynebacterium sp.]|uniref:SDR family NAD(P)-dependent oxidoreductase n=1 Tax=Corynebacterium sp. TaxID=1720 RepID=UPI00264777FB